MIDIPDSITEELSDSRYVRKDVEKVKEAIRQLSVTPPSFFTEFYERYVGPFWSEKLGCQLLDIIEDGPNIIESTELCRNQFMFPSKYLVITDLSVGQVVVLNSETDEVYEVDFEGGEQMLLNGELRPRWISFKDFVVDYF